MTNLQHSQRGVTAIGWLTILGIIGFFTLLILKLLPLYMEKSKVNAAVDYVVSQQDAPSRKKSQIIDQIVNNLQINNVERFDERTFKNFGSIKKIKGGGRRIVIDYDIRGPMFGDIDVVLKYHKEAVIPAK